MDTRDIFASALQKNDPKARDAFLDEACRGDTALRRQVDELIEHHQQAGSFLQQPLIDTDSSGDSVNEGTEASGFEPGASFTAFEPSEKPNCIGTIGENAQYEVEKEIGRGGMGIVYKALDTKLHRTVAVKVLMPHFASNPTACQRFLREARAAAAISSEYVVRIFAVDATASLPYLVMELIDGQSLEKKIAEIGALSLREILRIGMQTATGLDEAHQQGVVHRDIKPENILLENGVERVHITDFGLARVVDDVSITQIGQIAGTPQYMAPEQARGESVDHRADLFSLGCVLYAMCTGRAAFRADSATAAIARILHDTPRPIREVNPEIPQWLTEIIDRLLTKSPDDRYQTADEVAALLRRQLAGLQSPMHAGTAPSSQPFESAGLRSNAGLSPRWAVVGLVLLASVALAITESTGLTNLLTTSSQDHTETESGTPGPDVENSPGQSESDIELADNESMSTDRSPIDAADALLRQQEWAERLKLPVEYTNSVGMTLALIPPGLFDMGSQAGDPNERPAHRVRLTKPYYLGICEVTQHEYQEVIGTNPSIEHLGDNQPVQSLPFEDAVSFCGSLSERENAMYRIPTSAEWEFACRAGTTTAWSFGDDSGDINDYAWVRENADEQAHPVAQKRPNAFGLFDMHGNLWEFCSDWHGDYSAETETDPQGPSFGKYRDFRGGSWFFPVFESRSANRPDREFPPLGTNLGFRVLLEISDDSPVRSETELSRLQTEIETGLPTDPRDPKCVEVRDDLIQLVRSDPSPVTAIEAARLSARVPWPIDVLVADAIPDHEIRAASFGESPSPPEGLVAVLGESRLAHWEHPLTVAFDPSGTIIASASRDNSVRLWDVATGREIRTILLPGWGVFCAAFVDRGDEAAWLSVGQGQVVNVYEFADSAEPRAIQTAGWPNSIDISPDQTLLAAASNVIRSSYSVNIYQLESGELLNSLSHDNNISRIAFSPDGESLATVCSDRKLRIWSVADGRVQRTFAGSLGDASRIAFHPRNQTLAVASGSDVLLLDLSDTEEESYRVLGGHEDRVSGIAFNPRNENVLASCSHDGTIRLWDVDAAQTTSVLDYDPGVPFAIAFNPDGALLASTGDDLSIRLWSVSDAKEVRKPTGHRGLVHAAAVSPDGTTLASAGADHTVRIWDLATGGERVVLRGHSAPVRGVTFTLDGRTVVSGGEDAKIRTWNRETGEEISDCPTSAAVHCLEFSPSGQVLATGDSTGTVNLWNWPGLTLRTTLTGHTGPVNALAFRPDGRELATGSTDQTVRCWDLRTDEARIHLGHSAGVRCVAFSPDGQTLASGGEDHTVIVWNGSRGTIRQTLTEHESTVNSISFRPDGERLLTGCSFFYDDLYSGADNRVRIWDPNTGQLLESRETNFPGWCLTGQSLFTPDGRHFIRANGNGTLYVVRLQSLE